MHGTGDGWRFRTEDAGRWVWQRVSDGGEIVLASDLDFESLELCAVDAQRFGYPGVLAEYARNDHLAVS